MTKAELKHLEKAAHILDKEQSRTCYNDDEADVFDYASDVLQTAIRAASLEIEPEIDMPMEIGDHLFRMVLE
jgi:hypothetical protein